ncbi:MAG: hypothetical protein AVDCRST_MAG86-377, partial [uncultured Truepera sp.]
CFGFFSPKTRSFPTRRTRRSRPRTQRCPLSRNRTRSSRRSRSRRLGGEL